MKRIVIASALLAAGAATAIGLWFLRPDPTGMATGRIDPAERALYRTLWQSLEPFGPVFLKAFGDTLREPPEDPFLLANTFNELAYQVTGRTGIWRKTLPNDYFGCPADPDVPICVRLRDLEAQFTRWDRLQERIGQLDDERQARAFLRENAPALQEYIKTLVPVKKSLTAIQATPFFAQNLAPVLKDPPPVVR
jgi:hypothetical protein